MTTQEAAAKILEEIGTPLSSKEIAKIALERRMKSSSARDPILSLSQTIEKNIREGLYNRPELEFVRTSKGRLIGLPSWNFSRDFVHDKKTQELSELTALVPTELLNKIKLADQAKLANTFDETVSFILTKGLSIITHEIKAELMKQLDSIDSLPT
ncbi:HTH domain-containing protein [Oceanidesulfovibrio marinus]|uniref:HTH HARE-type domain-containing protein n=1 Tax=Oceanidesulfovibrio marinus TaxID=370038 RepID=A0A6P1ZET6_9BACT|nr:HTH domain-containing protein [Oceanidesulfovibrio marinus]TVM32344.1 hypothetical protein DQK91_15810 [Oceanidesulfovibrio marinus]